MSGLFQALLGANGYTSLASTGEPRWERLQAEHEVRVAKRRGQVCPFSRQGRCTNLGVRCGERQQHSSRETPEERRLPHACHYEARPDATDYIVLLVDDTPLMRRLAREYLVGLGVGEKRIFESASAEEASEVLFDAKQKGIVFALVVSDIRMESKTGYDLVNFLVERNYMARVILTSSEDYLDTAGPGYLGEEEVIDGERVVSAFLPKPMKVHQLAAEIRKLEAVLN